MRGAWTAVAVASVALAVSAGGPGSVAPAASAGAPRAAGPVTVVAVGDIVCAPGSEVTSTTCRHRATARLAADLGPDRVLALGDLQYETGSLAAFRSAYDASWGRLLGRTLPVPGNHEYDTRGASGYYSYFSRRQPGPPGWYARDLGRWRAYLLNSNCDEVDCDAQARWLARDLANNPRRCSLMVTHHPRWSSGLAGNDRTVARFFRLAFEHRVELVLSGHDHHYERFVPKRPDGTRSARGVVQFVSGTGGKSLHPVERVEPGSAYRITKRFGVLRLSLGDGRYSWAWKGIGGATRDAGSRSCTV